MQSLRELEKLIYVGTGPISLKKEKSSDFFKKHRNRYLIDIIFNFLDFDDKVRLRFLNRLVFSVIALKTRLTNFKQLKEDFIIFVNNKFSFESCIYAFESIGLKQHVNLLINEFYSTWAYSNYFEKSEGPITIDLHHNSLPANSKQLLLATLSRINKPLELELYSIDLKECDISTLLNNLKNKDVRVINLGKNCVIQDDLADTIAEILPGFNNLTQINLDHSIDSDYVLTKVTFAFRSLFKLERIELNECRFTNEGLDTFLNNISKIPKLKHLYLNDNNIDAEGANLLGLYLGSWMSSSLLTFSLNDNPINHIGVGYIMKGVRTNKSLTHLSLSNNRALLSGFEVFVNSLQGNKTLRKIKYTQNEISRGLITKLNEEILPETTIDLVELFNKHFMDMKLKPFKTHKILL
jgi:hypothetical protein